MSPVSDRSGEVGVGDAILLAQFVLDMQAGTPFKHAGAPARCPACRTDNESGIWLLVKGKLCCRNCAPLTRRCARCEKRQSVVEFDVDQKRMILSSYCLSCRRAKARKQYADAQSMERPLASVATCSTCGLTKSRAAFYVDKRYATGLAPRCRKCNNSYNAEYQREHPRSRS